jgi:hypothetical protein
MIVDKVDKHVWVDDRIEWYDESYIGSDQIYYYNAYWTLQHHWRIATLVVL